MEHHQKHDRRNRDPRDRMGAEDKWHQASARKRRKAFLRLQQEPDMDSVGTRRSVWLNGHYEEHDDD
ncbi:MAG: hypothetical protein OEU36_25205 [Gammaproteobacteria bacterium]|nr:hypothetical protein [Gammaproteobacteria bacterium]